MAIYFEECDSANLLSNFYAKVLIGRAEGGISSWECEDSVRRTYKHSGGQYSGEATLRGIRTDMTTLAFFLDTENTSRKVYAWHVSLLAETFIRDLGSEFKAVRITSKSHGEDKKFG